jgi:hypothetical protein
MAGERYRFTDKFGNVIDAIGRVKKEVLDINKVMQIQTFMAELRRDLQDLSPEENYAVTRQVYGQSTGERLGRPTIASSWEVSAGKFSGRGTRVSSGISIKILNPAKHLSFMRFGAAPHPIPAGNKPIKFYIGAPLRWGLRSRQASQQIRSMVQLRKLEQKGKLRQRTSYLELAPSQKAWESLWNPHWVTITGEVNHPGPLKYRQRGGEIVPISIMHKVPGLGTPHFPGDFVRAALDKTLDGTVKELRDALPRILLPVRKLFTEARFDASRWVYEPATILEQLTRGR